MRKIVLTPSESLKPSVIHPNAESSTRNSGRVGRQSGEGAGSKCSKFCISLVLFLLGFLTVHSSSAQADWPAFRGPSRDGVANGPLPTQWSKDSSNIVWRTTIPGEGWSSPIVVGKRIFLSAAIPRGESKDETSSYDLTLLSLDAQSGEVVSSLPLFVELSGSPRIHNKNSHASPTPLYDGENLYVHFGHQGTACVSLQGEVLWKNDTLAYPPVHGNGGSPTVVGDLLIFSRDGKDLAEVTALNKRTGAIVWQTARNVEARRQFSFCTPLVKEIDGKQQLILPGSNIVQSLDPRSGEEIWRLQYDGYSVIPRPIYESGLVFVCTGYDRPSLLAIDPSGTGDVTESHLKWTSKEAIPHTPSLVAYQGKIMAVSDKGIAVCFEAESGDLLWKKRIGGNFSASPLLVDNLLYLLSEQGDCTVLDISGDQPKSVALSKLGERCLASFAVVEDDLLLRSDVALYRIARE